MMVLFASCLPSLRGWASSCPVYLSHGRNCQQNHTLRRAANTDAVEGTAKQEVGRTMGQKLETNAWNLAFIFLKTKQTQSNSHIGGCLNHFTPNHVQKNICTRSLPPKASFSHTLAYIFEEPNMPCASFTPLFWIVKGLASKFRGLCWFVVFRFWQFDPFDPCPWAWRWDTSHEYPWICLFRLWTLFECQIQQTWSQLITCRWH